MPNIDPNNEANPNPDWVPAMPTFEGTHETAEFTTGEYRMAETNRHVTNTYWCTQHDRAAAFLAPNQQRYCALGGTDLCRIQVRQHVHMAAPNIRNYFETEGEQTRRREMERMRAETMRNLEMERRELDRRRIEHRAAQQVITANLQMDARQRELERMRIQDFRDQLRREGALTTEAPAQAPVPPPQPYNPDDLDNIVIDPPRGMNAPILHQRPVSKHVPMGKDFDAIGME